MGKLLCSKSVSLSIKPTSDCRLVENMLIACSKYIGTRKKSANICYKCLKMLQHANAWSNSATLHVFFFCFFLTILLYIILFSLCNVLYLTILFSHQQFYCTHLLFVISFSVMIRFSYCAQPLIRGIMFNYYRISNIYTSFDIPVSMSKSACLESWLVYTSAYIIP